MECDFCDIEIVKYSDDNGNNGYILRVFELGKCCYLCRVSGTYTVTGEIEKVEMALFSSHQLATAMKKRLFQQYMKRAIEADRDESEVTPYCTNKYGERYFIGMSDNGEYTLTDEESEAITFPDEDTANYVMQKVLEVEGLTYTH